MKLNILGTEYKITFKDYENDKYMQENSFCGYCDEYTKDIVICNMKTFPQFKNETDEKCMTAEITTLRHEIIHAFLNESGLTESTLQYSGGWAKNEEMVDWIAIQFPKILKAFKDAEALYKREVKLCFDLQKIQK